MNSLKQTVSVLACLFSVPTAVLAQIPGLRRDNTLASAGRFLLSGSAGAGAPSDRNNVVAIRVRYHPLSRALVFIATLVVIVRGNQQSHND